MRIRIISTSSHKHAIQVVSKTGGNFILHKHFGTYKTDTEKARLIDQAREYIQNYINQIDMFDDIPSANWQLGDVEIINSQPLYLYRLLARVYDSLGFKGDSLIRDLV